MFLASKIFEIKRKGIRDDVLASNIFLRVFWEQGWVKPDCRSVMSVEVDSNVEATDNSQKCLVYVHDDYDLRKWQVNVLVTVDNDDSQVS